MTKYDAMTTTTATTTAMIMFIVTTLGSERTCSVLLVPAVRNVGTPKFKKYRINSTVHREECRLHYYSRF